MEKLVENVARTMLRNSGIRAGDTILLHVGEGEDSWILQHTIVAEMKSETLQVFLPADGSSAIHYLFEVSHADVNVQYGDMFTEGMFSSKKVRRVVNARLACQLTDMFTQEVRYAVSLNDAVADTVLVDDIEKIETPGVRATHSVLPSAPFLDKIVEPFVIIGATGVAIYLLFHVRS